MRLRFRDKNPPSRLERRFLLYWQSLGGPEFNREFRFHMDRKWRADFAHVESLTLIEVEGGIYIQGRRNARRASQRTPRSIWRRRWLAGASSASPRFRSARR